MSKNALFLEFEINAPTSLIYSYLTIPNSIKQWFADQVKEDKEGVLNFIWDNEDHFATLGSLKPNHLVRYIFKDKLSPGKTEAPYIEFKLEANELTQTSFLKITDSYLDESEEDSINLWKNLIDNLKGAIGA